MATISYTSVFSGTAEISKYPYYWTDDWMYVNMGEDRGRLLLWDGTVDTQLILHIYR